MNRRNNKVGGSRRSESGQSMVEFMLVVIFVFLLFVSMLQMIMLMHTYNTLGDAAKEGLRFAIVHGTGFGSGCSGPGSVNLTPSVSCADPLGSAYCASNCDSVVNAVTNFAAVSFQNVSSSNVTVSYDPSSANTSNPNFGAACSQPGCAVKVTVSFTYKPLFGFSWPSFTLNAAADGIIAN